MGGKGRLLRDCLSVLKRVGAMVFRLLSPSLCWSRVSEPTDEQDGFDNAYKEELDVALRKGEEAEAEMALRVLVALCLASLASFLAQRVLQ